ncbi:MULTISPECIES: hypothetical protein [unclassified Paenibacillus]|uniref:hypothetical protein n=1 Tax=unclassified Paenibacillus TaxID=185978 RepID=UPI001AE696DF|nr:MULTISPECIES: hypothetical protein [unclassified Paenibacillus]MBP1156140.1 putative SAM-dependent methyltransferase [Paenibacillus sp. PvP091]MBP1168474.1 putative SAM-dependent methyltransferase [Paenibacillus sp. PvR098]MBP2439502.1 putative SAM-dependent methyltransferase [Paenibacillus sp. PvP052]
MYNQQGYQNSFQNQMGANTSSQSRQARYQPAGSVQSQYNQSLNQGTNSQFSAGMNQSNGSLQNTASYQTANYRGNQQGHDAYLRADSTQPSQSQYGIGASQMGMGASQLGNQLSSSYNTTGMNQQFGASNQQYGQNQNPQSFHTANYRGDQSGHDAYLRADSTQPAQSQYGIGASQMGMGMGTNNQLGMGTSQMGMGITQMGNQMSSSYNTTGMNQQFGASNQQYGQNQNPQTFHTANYRGDQPAHDAYLRADSTQPSQSQLGMSTNNMGYSR